MDTTTRPAYTRIAIGLHWLVAFLILANFYLGLLMDTFAKHAPQTDAVLFLHASIGSLIFMLAAVRLFWRITHPPAPLPASVPRWQVLASHALHGLLYVLMLAVPLTGYVHRLAGGHKVDFFGLGALPVFIGRDETLRVLTHSLHEGLVWLLAVLVLGHLAAVLKHRFVDRDKVFGRMLGRA